MGIKFQIRLPVLLFLFFLSFYLIFMGGHFYFSDGKTVFLTTQSIVENKTFAISEGNGSTGPDGKFYGKYGIGQTIIEIPFYLAGKYISGNSFIEKGSIKAPFWSYFFITSLNCLFTALSCMILFLISAKFYSPGISILISLIFGIFTMAFPYSKHCFSEPILAFCLLAAFYFLMTGREKYSLLHLLFSGFFLGLGFATRISFIIYLPVLFTYLMVLSVKEKKANPISSAIIFLVLPVVWLAIIFYYNYIRFGDIFSFGYINEHFTTPVLIGIYGFLFSSGKSIFLYNPPLLAAIPAFPHFYKQNKKEALLITAMSLIALFYFSKWWSWQGGECWGPRFLLPVIPFMLIPAGKLLENLRRRISQILFIILLIASIWVQIMGISLEFTKYLEIPAFISHYPESMTKTVDDNLYTFDPYYSPILGHWWILKKKLGFSNSSFIQFSEADSAAVSDAKLDLWALEYGRNPYTRNKVYPIFTIFLILNILSWLGIIRLRE